MRKRANYNTTKDEDILFFFFFSKKTSTLTHRKDESEDVKSKRGSFFVDYEGQDQACREGSIKDRIGLLVCNFQIPDLKCVSPRIYIICPCLFSHLTYLLKHYCAIKQHNPSRHCWNEVITSGQW